MYNKNSKTERFNIMKNTGKKMYMKSHKYNWDFYRTIWEDGDGHLYVRVNKYDIRINSAKDDCDEWHII